MKATMENYYRLPAELYNRFITVPDGFIHSIVTGLGVGHNFTNYPTNELITEEGIKYFSDRGFVMDKLTAVFKMSAGDTGPVHSDRRRVGVNVILQGSGAMEWLEVDADVVMMKNVLKTGTVVEFPMYETIRSAVPIDKTETTVGDFLIARIDKPHRVSCSSVDDRIVLSFRMNWDYENVGYDQIISNFK